METWTKQRLDQMISDGIEESLTLDYKRWASLGKDEKQKTEITKDISSFANSSGGVVIYGVSECPEKERQHLPEKLDPLPRGAISKEWLEQVIQNIQPRINGVVVHPVTINEVENTVCYVVEIPQSYTAHQARDHRYYKRHNFNILPMEDYEIRDVMNRKSQPKMRVAARVAVGGSFESYLGLHITLENLGPSTAYDVFMVYEIPDSGTLVAYPSGEVWTRTESALRGNSYVANRPIHPLDAVRILALQLTDVQVKERILLGNDMEFKFNIFSKNHLPRKFRLLVGKAEVASREKFFAEEII